MTGPWISGESLSPSRLNLHAGAATLVTGFSTNTLQAQSGLTVNVISDLSVQNTAAAQRIELGGAPSTMSGLLSLRANSAQSDYLFLQDSTGAKSNFLLGLRTGDSNFSLVDGLNLYDTSHNTMIVRFSSDSVRFYPPIVAPVFDTGGALAGTYNAALYLRGGSKESQIQAAINAAAGDGIPRVYVPANLYPYSAASVSFDTRVQMVREGGNWALYDVFAYGGDKASLSNSSAFQAACNGAGAVGGAVYVPSGTWNLASTVTLTTPAGRTIALYGDGRNATIIQGTQPTMDILSVMADQSVIIRDLAVSSSTSKTAGAGIRVAGNGGVNSYSIFQNLIVALQWNGIDFVSAAGWNLQTSYIVTNSNYGVYVRNTVTPDNGDSTIGPGCIFDTASAATAAIHQESSGGLKIIANKILHHTTGLDVAIADGVSTSILLMCGNSLEAQSGQGVVLRRLGSTGTFSQIAIVGNQFAGTHPGVEYRSGNFINSSIQGNVFTGSGLSIANASAINITGNTFSQSASVPVSAISLAATAASILIGENFYSGFTLPITNNSTSLTALQTPLILGTADAGGSAWIRGQVTATQSNEVMHFTPSLGTQYIYGEFFNTNGSLLWGVECNAGPCVFAGASNNAAVIGTDRNQNVEFAQNNTVRVQLTSTTWQPQSASGLTLGTAAIPWSGLYVGDGAATSPRLAFGSEASLGLYRSGASTVALSYGSFNLNQARFVSIRTQGSLDSTTLAQGELAIAIAVASGASMALRSGNTIYYWTSSASTKG